jgi:hypothetical protein
MLVSQVMLNSIILAKSTKPCPSETINAIDKCTKTDLVYMSIPEHSINAQCEEESCKIKYK